MTIEFRFNGSRQAILIPESPRDRQLLQLCFGERPELHIMPSAGEHVIIEARDAAPVQDCTIHEQET